MLLAITRGSTEDTQSLVIQFAHHIHQEKYLLAAQVFHQLGASKSLTEKDLQFICEGDVTLEKTKLLLANCAAKLRLFNEKIDSIPKLLSTTSIDNLADLADIVIESLQS